MTARVTIIDDNGNNKGTYELRPTRREGRGDIITKYIFEFVYTEVNDEVDSGMTIDNSLEWLISRKEHYEMDDNCQELAQALDTAIKTMRKYQKIEQIVSDFKEYQKGISCGFGGEVYMQMVSEVVEDATN